MVRCVTFVSEFDTEEDSKKKIRKKSLHLRWEYQSLIIEVWEHRWSTEHAEYLAKSFNKRWDFNIHRIIDENRSDGSGGGDYYPKNIDPINIRTILEMANTCERKAAEGAMYQVFFELEIVPRFNKADKFGEGWLKEQLPHFWEYWAEKTLSDREADAKVVMDG